MEKNKQRLNNDERNLFYFFGFVAQRFHNYMILEVLIIF